MSVPLKWVEVHSPLFLAGCNLGLKLDPKRRPGLKLSFNQEDDLLEVEWNNEVGFVPLSNVALMVKGDIEPYKESPAPFVGKIEAQVSTPQDHVFKGPGAGKTK